MGLDHTGTRLLIYARSCGVNFDRTVMIGRQGLHVDKTTLATNFGDFGMNAVDSGAILKQADGYAEPFLKSLGAREVDSMDASDYESATIIHDMNLPVADQHKTAFDVVLDGGSLEHIFNFPIAIKSCMEMVRPGGYFLGITPANNFLGHGFYQFSPEVYFRVFSPENGFQMERMLFFVDEGKTKWYEVKDPKEVKERVALCNSRRSYLFVMARRISTRTIFASNPQQSDYQDISWKRRPELDQGATQRSIVTRIADRMIHLRHRCSVLFKETGGANQRFFTRIDKKNGWPTVRRQKQ
jgi:hypothetical protein